MKKSLKFIIYLFIIMWVIHACSDSQAIPLKCYQNQHDYSFMWWKKTIKEGNQVFAIKTSRYALDFDYKNLAIQSLIINRESSLEDAVLRETNAESIPEQIPFKLDFGLKTNGEMVWCKSTSGRDDDCQLVETGKYFQRRFITNLPELEGCDPFNSGLVISSWPDRLSFVLKVTLAERMEKADVITKITFPERYRDVKLKEDMVAFTKPGDGSGFIVLKTSSSANLSVDGLSVTAEFIGNDLLSKDSELSSGLVIYPVVDDIDKQMEKIADQENQPLLLKAEQIEPVPHPLEVRYSKEWGWHKVVLRNDMTESNKEAADPGEGNPGPQDDLNKRMERVLFTVENPSDFDRIVRLNFAKGRLIDGGSNVFSIPGISAVLRDTEGNPIGIPLQLSKNWHSGGRTGVDKHYFEGPWYHGLSMITVPANSTISLEYTSVNSLWGGVPAASHAQLCLIGWGSNQQWDQAAIGAWGENITYEPDLDQASAPILDFRPLLVKNPSGKKWGWTGNVGGADIFNYTKTDGKRGWHSRIRTQYKRYSPNYTEVTYAGIMDDQSMDFEYTASVGRSDDITRGIYKIKLKVLKDTDFNDFVVFQAAADMYHYGRSRTMAWGNEDGLQEEWAANIGDASGYVTEKQEAAGNVPWFSFTDGEFNADNQNRFLPANRGIVIREWKARINGEEGTLPWFAQYNTTAKGHGDPSNLFNITPPEGCTSFQAGDCIEAEIVLFIVPIHAEEYYGPNKNFKEALKAKANTWKMVYREAIGNDLQVEVSNGTLVNQYPVEIIAENNSAQFSITGGCGYVPLTITGVNNYRDPRLYRKVDGSWQRIDQSFHGNDFWQTEYNSSSETWDITYNINLDSKDDKRKKVDFRFEIKP